MAGTTWLNMFFRYLSSRYRVCAHHIRINHVIFSIAHPTTKTRHVTGAQRTVESEPTATHYTILVSREVQTWYIWSHAWHSRHTNNACAYVLCMRRWILIGSFDKLVDYMSKSVFGSWHQCSCCLKIIENSTYCFFNLKINLDFLYEILYIVKFLTWNYLYCRLHKKDKIC
jgi:hypothetical protein